MFSIENIFFSIAGQGVSYLEFLGVIAGLGCVFLATRGRVLNFWVGYLYNILLFCMFLQKHLYSSMLLQPISFIINFFGHWRWTHPKKGEENSRKLLKVTLLTNKQRAIYLLMIAVFTLVWGFFLSKLNLLWPNIFPMARTPYLDAMVTGFILLAQLLSAQKKLDCWGVWLIVNTTNIVLYIKAGLAFLPFVCAGYIVLAIMGFFMWRKEYLNGLVRK